MANCKHGLEKEWCTECKDSTESKASIVFAQKLKEETEKKLDLDKIPENIPLDRLGILEAIIEAKRNVSVFAALQRKFPNAYHSLILRFGLDNSELNKYRTLEEVGKLMKISRERVRQLESKALHYLGIENLNNKIKVKKSKK